MSDVTREALAEIAGIASNRAESQMFGGANASRLRQIEEVARMALSEGEGDVLGAVVCGHRWDDFVCHVALDENGSHAGDHLSGPGQTISRTPSLDADFPRPKPWMRVSRNSAIREWSG